MKNVLLDGSVVSAQVASGITNYVTKLIRYFKIFESRHSLNSTIAFKARVPVENIFLKEANLQSSDLYVLSHLKFMKYMLFGHKGFDLIHSPYMFLPPKTKRSVNVLTVHDTINLERPFSIKSEAREALLRLAIARADYYICISHTTKDKLKLHYPAIPDEQVFVIYQGIDEAFFGERFSNACDELTREPYILYVGQRRGYKNFDALLRFISHSRKAIGLKILCVGGGRFTEDELKMLSMTGLSKRVIHAGHIQTEELKYLYMKAIALAYTSLHEGFGLPIMEAMAVGCPVICGNFSSMKEIANSLAIMVDDFSISSFEEALDSVYRISPAQVGEAKQYASNFTWEKTAWNTLEMYSKVLSGSI